jgi:hypothetical protein
LSSNRNDCALSVETGAFRDGHLGAGSRAQAGRVKTPLSAKNVSKYNAILSFILPITPNLSLNTALQLIVTNKQRRNTRV